MRRISKCSMATRLPPPGVGPHPSAQSAGPPSPGCPSRTSTCLVIPIGGQPVVAVLDDQQFTVAERPLPAYTTWPPAAACTGSPPAADLYARCGQGRLPVAARTPCRGPATASGAAARPAAVVAALDAVPPPGGDRRSRWPPGSACHRPGCSRRPAGFTPRP